jgi:NTE family protein
MTPQHVISQLLKSDAKYHKNFDLLKKIILTAYLARLQINGLPPDNKIALGNYLFDHERVMFDFSRLSEHKKNIYNQWLLDSHQKEKQRTYLGRASVNEYRGFTAEVALSWWGRLISWFKNRYSEQWKINDLSLSINYQLTGIEICHGLQGLLVGFNQYLVPHTGTKYKGPQDSQKEPLGNTKRIFITDKLIDKLRKFDLKTLNIDAVCNNPHPQAIHVVDPDARLKEMQNYRRVQKFLELNPWYLRVWKWAVAWLNRDIKKESSQPRQDNNFTLLHENDTTQIYERSISKEILVKEKRPDIKNMVLCGGGAKIFAHVGVWKALCEAKIIPEKFAGSSAGAIMALLCYLGYTAEEITALFKHFRQEHLVYFDITRNGLSDPKSLKTALDYAIARKVQSIAIKYNIPYPHGKITFAVLEALRIQCPGCGLGYELIVTATNKKLRKTQYFSLEKTPLMEVSEAVKVSASFPILYRNTLINGEEHNDGGVLNNFPTDAFYDDRSTLLESEYGNNLRVLAVQFDNGTERNTIDRVMDKVYRENFLLNWVYSVLTGVSDPASGWEQDRLKLRKYAAQSIVVNVGTVSSTGFNVEEDTQRQLIESGYQATKDYLAVRYKKRQDDSYENKELMYSSFASLGDLLSYCCYRANINWFNIVNELIINSSLPNRAALMKQAADLRDIYFNSLEPEEKRAIFKSKSVTFFAKPVVCQPNVESEKTPKVFLALYPIILKLSPTLLKTSDDKRTLELAHHSVSLYSPFGCLEHFDKIKGENHILFHIIIALIGELEIEPCEKTYDYLKWAEHLLTTQADLLRAEYYAQWNLSLPQCFRVLNLFKNSTNAEALFLLNELREKNEPMQTINEGKYTDDFDDVFLTIRP